jgi:hypothetical protein
MMMQVSAQAMISCGMELVPGCDRVDKGGIKWDDGAYTQRAKASGSAGLTCGC